MRKATKFTCGDYSPILLPTSGHCSPVDTAHQWRLLTCDDSGSVKTADQWTADLKTLKTKSTHKTKSLTSMHIMQTQNLTSPSKTLKVSTVLLLLQLLLLLLLLLLFWNCYHSFSITTAFPSFILLSPSAWSIFFSSNLSNPISRGRIGHCVGAIP